MGIAWEVYEHQGSSCLWLPSTRIIAKLHRIQLFYVGSGGLNSDLHPCTACTLMDWAFSPALDSCGFFVLSFHSERMDDSSSFYSAEMGTVLQWGPLCGCLSVLPQDAQWMDCGLLLHVYTVFCQQDGLTSVTTCPIQSCFPLVSGY